MSSETLTFSSYGFQKSLNAGDILYVLAENNPRSGWGSSIGVFPDAAATTTVEVTYSPVGMVKDNPADPKINWLPWDLGPITAASSKKDDTFTGFFTAIKITSVGGKSVIDGGR